MQHLTRLKTANGETDSIPFLVSERTGKDESRMRGGRLAPISSAGETTRSVVCPAGKHPDDESIDQPFGWLKTEHIGRGRGPRREFSCLFAVVLSALNRSRLT